MKDVIEQRLSGKDILILGYGREGHATLKELEKYIPAEHITIADANPDSIPAEIKQNFRTISGEDYCKGLDKYDIIIKTPGISDSKLADVDKIKVTSQTDLFLQCYNNQTIGITGTKGKSTTSSLIYHLLKQSGQKAVLVGNIGIPAFCELDKISKDSIIVMELSAHQLQHLHKAPHIAVFLNIYEEHLDYFGTFNKYYDAKCNIFLKQQSGDILITDLTIPDIASKLSDYHNKIIDYGKNPNAIGGNLQGKHNLKNIAAAIEVAKLYNIANDIISNSILNFAPLPHRLEYVGIFEDIIFYNDSISTIPEAAIAAIEAIGNIDSIILGGFDRGINYNRLCKYLIHSELNNIILIGQAGERIGEILEEKGCDKSIYHADKMIDVVNYAFGNTTKGKVCLLSPAASSYDMFKNFEDRGNKYKELIVNHKKNTDE